MIEIDNKITAPLFIQAKNWIIQELKERGFAEGDRIPSENEFCRKSRVSIRTIRRALLELEKDGIIIRHQGRGSFLKELKSSVQGKNSKIIGILFSDIAFITHSTLANILRGVEYQANKLGYSFHLYSTGDRTKTDSELQEMGAVINKDDVIGLIATSAINDRDINWINRNKIPLVTFNDYRKTQTNVIRYDYYTAARQGIRCLVSQGYKKIAFFCGHFSDDSFAAVFNNDYFLKGIKDELQASGLKFDPDMVFSTNPSSQEGEEHAGALLNSRNKPDAFFSFDETVMLGILSAIHKNFGKTNIYDLGLVTCGGKTTLDNVFTLRIPMFEIGKTSVDLLIKNVNGDRSTKKKKLFKPTLLRPAKTATAVFA